uniref:Synembryn n=1 Tax=Anopheles maculatus TaxID=74869 RepID=A0A182S9Z2_9DIPT
MDVESLTCLLSGDYGRVKEALAKFNKQNSQVFNFTHFTSTGQWVLIWNKLFEYLADPVMPHRVDCLMAIKVLARDKTYLNETVSVEQLDGLLQLAGIGTPDGCDAPEEVQVEALKCLSNMIFQSTKCQEMCLSNSSTEGIIRRVKMYKYVMWEAFGEKIRFLISFNSNHREAPYGYDIKYFDMKLLFLLTAINCDIRAKVRDQLHGLVYLVETLDLFMSQAAIFKEFSIVLLHSNIVNLLTSVPVSCYIELVCSLSAKHDTPTAGDGIDPPAVVPFEGNNVYVLHVLVEFLRKNFQKAEKKTDQYEMLSPILTVLIKAVRADGVHRRYVRSIILPPLRDVRDRPEVGKELRNYLCSLLTSPCTQIADLSAELLFVLCKENVGRMIKYTGYGNAAGLFANRGLLGGRTGNGGEQYSSDSEDSDTEEYKQIQHAINPVIGCYEPPKPNPLEGMSEEQKEYEAMELVKLMDKLQRQGLIQPCKIGEDGRPQAVDHIMELQDEIPEQQRDHKRKT